MEPIVKKLIQADFHQITTAWSEGRVTSPEKVKNLATAMAQEGQQVPLVAVAEKDQLMLLDGYARLDAARQCGWDQAWVEVWSRGLKTGLARILGENQGRRWDLHGLVGRIKTGSGVTRVSQ